VSPELFGKVQEVTKSRYRNPGFKGSIGGFPLRGIARCASCRGRMTAERHDRWGYYRCSRQTFRRELCDARFCNIERAHTAVRDICRRLQLNREMKDQILAAAKGILQERIEAEAERRHATEQQLAAISAAESRLTDAFAAADLEPEKYTAKMTELKHARSTAERLLGGGQRLDDTAQAVGKALDVASSLGDLYDRLDDYKKAELLRCVFRVIVLDHRGVVGYSLQPQFSTLFRQSSDMTSYETAAGLVNSVAA
jgi:Recombinase zinc beta ribbon domain